MIGVVPPADARRTASIVGLVMLVAVSITLLGPVSSAGVRTEAGGPGVGPDPEPDSSSRALRLLTQIAAADDNVRYRGVQFVSAWDPAGTTSAVVETKNVPGDGTAFRVRGGSEGEASTVFVVAPGDIGIQLGGGPVNLLARNYTVEIAGRDEVSGRQTQVLEMLGARGAVAARLWADTKTGLLLRREVYDSAGRTVRASVFGSIKISDQLPTGHLPPVLPGSPGEDLSISQVADLRRAGCTCPTKIGHLSLYQVRNVTASGADVLHLSYSDGLSTVSVFQQPGELDSAAMVGYTEVSAAGGTEYVLAGPPQNIVWSADGVVYSLVADAPSEIVQRVVARLPHEKPRSDGVAQRIGRGLVRVGSWVNPFA